MGVDPDRAGPPVPDAAAARARRSLAASRAARTGITTMVDALRISKPPRAPPKPGAPPTAPSTARRHALIPLAEGRPELEARIRSLEDVVASRDEALLRLKRQWARALIRRRHHDRVRDALLARLSAAVAAARTAHTAASNARADLCTLADDVAAAATGSTADDHLAAAVDLARSKLSSPLADLDASVTAPITAPPPPPPGPSSRAAGSDDDARSCGSFASSALGEDREAQLESLAELVAVLDAKLAAGPPHPGATHALSRARRTLASNRTDANANGDAAETELATLRSVVDDVLATAPNAPDAELVVQAAEKEMALRVATTRLDEMTQRVATLEKIAGRAMRADDMADRCATLEAELATAKKTITRLVQQTRSSAGGLRGRGTPATGTPGARSPKTTNPNAPRTNATGDADAIRRILDWRQSASSENHPSENHPPADAVLANGTRRRLESLSQSGIDMDTVGREPLPDRVVDAPRTTNREVSPSRKRKLEDAVSGANGTTGAAGPPSRDGELALSERSADAILDGSMSAQSLPVQGFLRRHDSFLSAAGGVSASGDEITLMKHRNIFAGVGQPVDGLRGLLGG